MKDLNNNQQSFPKRNLNKVSLKTKSETVLTTIWVRILSLFKLFRKKKDNNIEKFKKKKEIGFLDYGKQIHN